MKISKRKCTHILNTSTTQSIPQELLLGVYMLETTYRKWYHRIAENALTILSVILCIFFKRPVRNYTIGCCQIGLATLLTISGRARYRHSAQIDNLKWDDLACIMRGMTFSRNVEVCSKHLKNLLDRELIRGTMYNTAIRNVGEDFNGKYTYGLMLEDLCMRLR